MDETRISRLLKEAGRREAPPEAARERVFDAVQAHWQSGLQTRRRERQPSRARLASRSEQQVSADSGG